MHVNNDVNASKTAKRTKVYSVIGWARPPDEPKSRDRTPLGVTRIRATSQQEAIRLYARSKQIPDIVWNDGTSNPPIIIRIVAVGSR